VHQRFYYAGGTTRATVDETVIAEPHAPDREEPEGEPREAQEP
jgi:hypothetical protein